MINEMQTVFAEKLLTTLNLHPYQNRWDQNVAAPETCIKHFQKFEIEQIFAKLWTAIFVGTWKMTNINE